MREITLEEKIEKVKSFKEPVIYINPKDKDNFKTELMIPVKTTPMVDKGTFIIVDEADRMFFKLDNLDYWINRL